MAGVRCLNSVFFFPLSLSPLKMPRLVSSPGVYRTESAFLVSYKRLLTPEPNRSALPLRPRTRCVINGEQLQWKGGSTFNKVENVYPVKPEAGRRELLIPSTSSTLLTATSLCFLSHQPDCIFNDQRSQLLRMWIYVLKQVQVRLQEPVQSSRCYSVICTKPTATFSC